MHLDKKNMVKISKLLTFFIVFSASLYPQKTESAAAVINLLRSAREHIATDLAAADSDAHAALEQSVALKADSLIAKSFYTCGLVNYYKSRYYVSTDYYKKAIATDYAAAHTEFASSCWNNLGINYELNDQYQEAIKAYLNSLKFAEQMADSLSMHQSYINLGLLFTKTNDYDAAESYLNKAQGYFGRKKDTYNSALTCQNYGILCIRQGKMDLAMKQYAEANRLYEEAGETRGAQEVLINMVSAMLDRNRTDGLDLQFARIAEKNVMIHDGVLDGTIALQLGRYYLLRKEFGKAERYVLSAERSFKEFNMPAQLRHTYSILVSLYAMTGNTRQHDVALRQYDEITVEMFNRETADKIAEYKTIFEDEKKSAHIRTLDTEIANKDLIIQLSFLTLFFFFTGSMTILYLYLNIRQKRKALFERNMELSSAMAREANVQSISEASTPESGDPYFLKLYRELNERVTKNKLYLNPNLSVTDLSQQLNTNEKYISKAFSVGFGNNFYRFINMLRTNEAKKILTDPDCDHLTYDQIADRVGFNNQFTFQRQFKELTGLTPTSFRKSNRN